MGRPINQFHNDRIEALLQDHHGSVVIGEAPVDGRLAPTVILNPSRDSALMKEEIFGPILPLISFQKIDEAI